MGIETQEQNRHPGQKWRRSHVHCQSEAISYDSQLDGVCQYHIIWNWEGYSLAEPAGERAWY